MTEPKTFNYPDDLRQLPLVPFINVNLNLWLSPPHSRTNSSQVNGSEKQEKCVAQGSVSWKIRVGCTCPRMYPCFVPRWHRTQELIHYWITVSAVMKEALRSRNRAWGPSTCSWGSKTRRPYNCQLFWSSPLSNQGRTNINIYLLKTVY